jgi:hypothetical protein
MYIIVKKQPLYREVLTFVDRFKEHTNFADQTVSLMADNIWNEGNY